MPAIHYTLRWPDAAETVCYSPSLIVRERFEAGGDYPLAEFVARLRDATAIADARVRAKYGFSCSRAADELRRIEALAERFAATPGATVRVLGFDDAG